MNEFWKLEVDKDVFDVEILVFEEELWKVDKEEEDFWCEYNVFDSEMVDFCVEWDSVVVKYVNDMQLFDKFIRMNVYNDIFCIFYDGIFVMINGL